MGKCLHHSGFGCSLCKWDVDEVCMLDTCDPHRPHPNGLIGCYPSGPCGMRCHMVACSRRKAGVVPPRGPIAPGEKTDTNDDTSGTQDVLSEFESAVKALGHVVSEVRRVVTLRPLTNEIDEAHRRITEVVGWVDKWDGQEDTIPWSDLATMIEQEHEQDRERRQRLVDLLNTVGIELPDVCHWPHIEAAIMDLVEQVKED